MKFKLSKASDWGFEDSIDVSTLEDLLDIIAKYECSLVLNEDSIILYDDYLE